MNNNYGRMKKQELINELEKRDNRITKQDELLKMAAAEINGLELTNASARMFLGSLLQMALQEKEVEEIYIDKQYAYELLLTHYVDFTPADDSNIGVILKLARNENTQSDNVDTKQSESEVSEDGENQLAE